MKRILTIFSLLLIIISCSKEEKISTDFKDLPKSIQQQITNAERECPTCGIVLTMYTYNKKIVFGQICGGYSASKNLICDCFMLFYDQNGELMPYEVDRYKDINDKKKLVKQIYSRSE